MTFYAPTNYSLDSSLTEKQKQAVTFYPEPNSPRKNLIIEAGAGAGKTKVLTERVKWLLSQKSLPEPIFSCDLMIVTFTNDAQKELRHRLDNSDIIDSHFIPVSTIDSLFDSLVENLFPGWWLNHNFAENFKFPPRISLVSQNDVMKKMQEDFNIFLQNSSIESERLGYVIDFILAGGLKKSSDFFSFQKGTIDFILQLLCQDFFLSKSLNFIRLVSRSIHPATAYLVQKLHDFSREQFYKRINKGFFTYADKTVFLLENMPHKFSFSLKELIIDEYQDTNEIQHRILYEIAQKQEARMVVVGDPKQSIYGFRGASVDVFQSLVADPKWLHIVLNECFRAPASLLEKVNTLSEINFSWQNPKYINEYQQSFFYREAQKKHVPHNPLRSGLSDETGTTLEPILHLVSCGLVSVKEKKSKLKFNDLIFTQVVNYLKKFKLEHQMSWSEIVILCEKNSHVEKIKELLFQNDIPVLGFHAQKLQEIDAYPTKVAKALAHCLLGKEDKKDLYLIFSSPFFHMDKCDLISSHQEGSPFLDAFKNRIQPYRSLARENFFLAWQKLRWSFVHENRHQSYEFSEKMNPFAFWLSNQKINFLDLPEQIKNFEDKNNQISELIASDCIDVRTVHKAKGLQWPCVCFLPKFGGESRNVGQFISHLSGEYLDLTWLFQDVEQMSVVERQNNPDFIYEDWALDEKKKQTFFAQLRIRHEEDQERQRVFYTAFTRAQKCLILFHPLVHAVSQKGLVEWVLNLSAHPQTYLEQEVFARFARSQFETTNLAQEDGFVEFSQDSLCKWVHEKF